MGFTIGGRVLCPPGLLPGKENTSSFVVRRPLDSEGSCWDRCAWVGVTKLTASPGLENKAALTDREREGGM